ncbi:GNAT family N-acetyltransferase [Aliidiomarina halalkaliphila]|uniref:GNAT family N-acetyltransferase n=1 Tax=Aliidiomarina halalkaliphila TaxID=2593535 RepID=A0A552X4Q6_9GAMM|nr:peptidase C39 family protein [Aliidiomarina halalkaliphila]TRW50002.1 GNAT family N-acetyltransferase [Aliidiomarina halalkaliphila]
MANSSQFGTAKKTDSVPTAVIKLATADHLDDLLRIDKACFPYDAMSRRSFRRFVQHEHGHMVVLENATGQALGYAILLFRQATKLCRLYSFAVLPEAQGEGYGQQLMDYCIDQARAENCLFLRSEVRADQQRAVSFFERFGFVQLGLRTDYYDDHADALVFQKQLHYFDSAKVPRLVPLLTQSTEFTCGPASLLMALAWFDRAVANPQHEELEIWREATTIYMTSGHGGCGPHGLARAAIRRGLEAQVYVSKPGPVLLDSVRNEQKRNVMMRIQEADIAALKAAGVRIHHRDYALSRLEKDLNAGKLVIALISTWQFDRQRAPHWVLLTAVDNEYVYLNDPDDDLLPWQTITERQYLPIPRAIFEKAFSYGSSRLRAAVVLSHPRPTPMYDHPQTTKK